MGGERGGGEREENGVGKGRGGRGAMFHWWAATALSSRVPENSPKKHKKGAYMEKKQSKKMNKLVPREGAIPLQAGNSKNVPRPCQEGYTVQVACTAAGKVFIPHNNCRKLLRRRRQKRQAGPLTAENVVFIRYGGSANLCCTLVPGFRRGLSRFIVRPTGQA